MRPELIWRNRSRTCSPLTRASVACIYVRYLELLIRGIDGTPEWLSTRGPNYNYADRVGELNSRSAVIKHMYGVPHSFNNLHLPNDRHILTSTCAYVRRPSCICTGWTRVSPLSQNVTGLRLVLLHGTEVCVFTVITSIIEVLTNVRVSRLIKTISCLLRSKSIRKRQSLRMPLFRFGLFP